MKNNKELKVIHVYIGIKKERQKDNSNISKRPISNNI